MYATALAHPSNIFLENSSKIDSFSESSKQPIVLTLTGRVNVIKKKTPEKQQQKKQTNNNIQFGHKLTTTQIIFKQLFVMFTIKISILLY